MLDLYIWSFYRFPVFTTDSAHDTAKTEIMDKKSGKSHFQF